VQELLRQRLEALVALPPEPSALRAPHGAAGGGAAARAGRRAAAQAAADEPPRWRRRPRLRSQPSSARARRVAVTRAIKYAIDKIAAHDRGLAEHLRLAVRTGMFCVYTPPARDRVSWTL
jgi:hypothetical protein